MRTVMLALAGLLTAALAVLLSILVLSAHAAAGTQPIPAPVPVRTVPLEAHRSMMRPSLPWPTFPVFLLTQGATLTAPTAVAPITPAVTLSRPAKATEPTSPCAAAACGGPQIPRSGTPTAQPEGRGSPTAAQWATLRRCESGDDYANKKNPLYRGGYQIGFAEWAEYGGTGRDPADAAPAVQDAVALRMWQARGWEPWWSSSHCTGLR